MDEFSLADQESRRKRDTVTYFGIRSIVENVSVCPPTEITKLDFPTKEEKLEPSNELITDSSSGELEQKVWPESVAQVFLGTTRMRIREHRTPSLARVQKFQRLELLLR